MGKFVIELIKGDDRTVLSIFDTKDEALAAGPLFRQKYTREQGLIGCISAHVIENDQIDYSKYKIHNAWH